MDDAEPNAEVNAATPAEEPERIWVRATVTLRDLPCGGEALVDPTDPEIIGYLEGRYLVPLRPLETEVEPELELEEEEEQHSPSTTAVEPGAPAAEPDGEPPQ